MGHLLTKARTWDDRVEAAKTAWIAKDPAPRTRRTRRPARASHVRAGGWTLIAIGLLIASLQVLSLWPIVSMLFFAAPIVFVYLLVQAASESGTRRALERHAAAERGRPIDH